MAVNKNDVYVASSWKNSDKLDEVHSALLAEGLSTFDFRAHGNWWTGIEENHLDAHERLMHPTRVNAFEFDYSGLDCTRGLFVVQPCGLDTMVEAGFGAGRKFPVVIWGAPRDDVYTMMLHVVRKNGGVVLPSHVSLKCAARVMRNLVVRHDWMQGGFPGNVEMMMRKFAEAETICSK